MSATQLGDSIDFRLNLVHGESRAVVVASVPNRAVAADELLPVLYDLDDAAVRLAEAEAGRDGKEISCRAGCAACCRQLIPVSPHEARRIAQIVAALPDDRRREIENRFEHVLSELERENLLPQLAAADQIEPEADRAELGHAYFDLRLDCPFLENERCSIYADRPMACREYVVTSPPEHCWSPRTGPVEALAVAVNFSAALYRFGENGQPTVARWMPLVFSLRWSINQTNSDSPKLPAPDLFRRFMHIVV
jgi:Fe-S-cluster containining protein